MSHPPSLGPRPIPRGEQAMSFSAAVVSPAGYTLTYLLNNTTPKDLHASLLRAVKNNVMLPGEMDTLVYSLQCAGIVTTTARAAAVETTRRHCVRCHKSYLERDNGRTACSVPHSKGILQKSKGHNVLMYRNHHLCCNIYMDPSIPVSQPHPHFVGRHTTREANVEYNSFNVKTCHEHGCGYPAVASADATVNPDDLEFEDVPSVDMMIDPKT